MRLTAFAAAALFFAVPFQAEACAQDGRAARGTAKQDLVATATAAGFGTLVAAIDAAGLTEELEGKGPFTVFVPTEEAFAALPDGALQTLLQPQNKAQLRRILRNHVVPGRLTSSDVGNIDVPQMAPTASRGRVAVRADAKGFFFGDANVVRANVACGNGILHVIDRVVMPVDRRTEDGLKMAAKSVAPTSLLDALRAVPDGRFSKFLAAVAASGADQDWAQAESQGNWTVFVPTDEAFERLTDAERAALFDPSNRDALRALLDWHALPELQVWSFDFDVYELGPAMVSRERGRFVLDILYNGMVFVYTLRSAGVPRAAEEPFKARVLAGDIAVGGHVVHVIDRVMVPKALEGKLLASQAYREKDVEELAAASKSQDYGRRVLAEMVEQSESLGDEAALSLFNLGIRLLEEVLPVSRTGTILRMEDDRNDRAKLRERLQARIADLDRVWFATFLKHRPLATSLDAPIPGMRARAKSAAEAPTPAPVAPAADKSMGSAQPVDAKVREAKAVSVAVMEPQPRAASDLSWCKVLQAEVDSAVVTDAALRDAITKTGLPWRVRDRATGIEMLLVPPGTFSMGMSPGDPEAQSNEAPAHPVTLTQPFYLGRYEVTREQWDKAMASEATREVATDEDRDDGAPRPGGVVLVGSVELRDSKGNIVRSEVTTKQKADGTVVVDAAPAGVGVEQEDPTRPDLPATGGFTKCRDFCGKRKLRLPTEAEWEFACRAGASGPRYGNLDDIAWHRGNAGSQRKPVGGKAANALGFHDMIGNAWEWVDGWYGEYTRSPQTDPTGPATGTSRVMRGGYFNFEQGFCRASLRYGVNAPEFDNGCGFRVARNP